MRKMLGATSLLICSLACGPLQVNKGHSLVSCLQPKSSASRYAKTRRVNYLLVRAAAARCC
jgi:hypothetical protein